MRVVYMGSPEFAAVPLAALLQNGFDVAGVYTQPDRPAGRGLGMIYSAVKRKASALGIPVFQPDNFKQPEVLSELAGLNPDVIVVAAFGQILPSSVLNITPLKCINIHPSLLPKHRGPSPVPASLLAGDDFTGVSIMLMDEGIDTGPILARTTVPVLPFDSAASLTGKLAEIAARMIQEVLASWGNQEITPRPQDNSTATYSPRISKGDGRIDWHFPAAEIFRRVRAYYPWPGSYTSWKGKRLEIIWGTPVPGLKGPETPGTVIDLAQLTGEKHTCGVVTGEGLLNICRLQVEGRRPMTAAEFLAGQSGFIGSTLN